jgi:hypothetical protein
MGQHEVRLANYNALATLKGKRKIAPRILKTKEKVNPIMVKGRRISHTSGKINNINKASGQQITKRIHQRVKPIKVLIYFFFPLKQNVNHFDKTALINDSDR